MSVTRGNNQQTANPVEQSTGTTITSNAIPTGLRKGDILVAGVNLASGTATKPAGWTTHISNLGTSAITYLDYLVVGTVSALSNTYQWTGLTTGRADLFITAFRGVNPFTPWDATGSVGTNTGSGNSCVIAAITTVSDNCMLVSAITGNASTGPPVWTQPAGFTQVSHSTGTGKGAAYASDLFQGTAGSSGTQTWTWDQTNLEIRGVMGALRPAPGETICVINQALSRSYNW